MTYSWMGDGVHMIHLSEGVKGDLQIDPLLINRLNDVHRCGCALLMALLREGEAAIS